jgi:hypothetical protein
MNPKVRLAALLGASAIIAGLVPGLGELIRPFSESYLILIALVGLSLGFLTSWDIGAVLMVASSMPLTLTLWGTANVWLSEARGHETEAGVVGNVFFLCLVYYVLAGLVATFVAFRIGHWLRVARS